MAAEYVPFTRFFRSLLGRLDGNVEVFRRMYFWRNTLRTLSEIRDSLNRLMTHSDFRDALDAGPGDVRNAFHELRRKLNKSFDELFHDLRNTISAHLDEQLVADTLNKLDFDREGFIEIGDDRGGIHFRFAAELLVELILRDVPDKERLRVFDETLGGSAKLSQSVAAIDDALAVYMNARHLP